MKQPIRSSLGLASMLAIGLFMLGTASEVQATSSGCFLPSFAVFELLDDAPDDFVSDKGRCNAQCSKINTTCNKVAKSSAKCLKALFKGELGFEKIGCSDEEDAGACKDEVKDDFSDAPDFVKEDLASAKDDCKAAKDSCRDSCSGAM